MDRRSMLKRYKSLCQKAMQKAVGAAVLVNSDTQGLPSSLVISLYLCDMDSAFQSMIPRGE
jgi:hypothetical protein